MQLCWGPWTNNAPTPQCNQELAWHHKRHALRPRQTEANWEFWPASEDQLYDSSWAKWEEDLQAGKNVWEWEYVVRKVEFREEGQEGLSITSLESIEELTFSIQSKPIQPSSNFES